MKRFMLFFCLSGCLADALLADSRAWPPSPYSIISDRGDTIIRFDPKLDHNQEVISTRVQSFSYNKASSQYETVLDAELKGFWEPDYAVPATDTKVLVFVFYSPDTALAVIDTRNGHVLLKKTFSDLVPELYSFDYERNSTSTVGWCERPDISDGMMYMTGGLLQNGKQERGPSFALDLKTYQLTRQK